MHCFLRISRGKLRRAERAWMHLLPDQLLSTHTPVLTPSPQLQVRGQTLLPPCQRPSPTPLLFASSSSLRAQSSRTVYAGVAGDGRLVLLFASTFLLANSADVMPHSASSPKPNFSRQVGSESSVSMSSSSSTSKETPDPAQSVSPASPTQATKSLFDKNLYSYIYVCIYIYVHIYIHTDTHTYVYIHTLIAYIRVSS